jgi:AraC-like DNA-binding protein
MDALSEILKSLKMHHCAVGTLLLRAPWGLSGGTDFKTPTAFGLVEGDSYWMRIQGRPPWQVELGDVVLFPRGVRHCMGSSPDAQCDDMSVAWHANGLPTFEPSKEPAAPLRFSWGGSGSVTRLLGMAFGLALGNRNPLLNALPPVIVVRGADTGAFPWVTPATAFLAAEDAAGLPGFAATARLLAELILVSAVRSHMLEEPSGTRGWIRGLSDASIASALAAMHAEPGTDWSVAALAKRACLSRTTFATRFADLVEQSPIEYLTDWRMHLATQRIAHGKPNLTQLAFELGYTSDAAFRDAFKRRYGVPPSRYAPG